MYVLDTLNCDTNYYKRSDIFKRSRSPPCCICILYNNQTIKLPFDIYQLDNLYQPYRYTEYNVCDDTCESDLNDPFAKIFPDCKYHSANEFNKCNRNPNCLPGVSFIHLNARSLNCNFRQIEDYLKSLDYTFDVINSCFRNLDES